MRSETELIQRLRDNIGTVVHSANSGVEWLLAAFIAGGHVLLEDVPGTGKTTLARALAGSIEAGFKRIQFTPDLLPNDILGVSVYDQSTSTFSFREGPVFTQILLADEINRASPRTQSALLEAMGEGQVSIDGEAFAMDELFFVIATQNPVEYHGTYPLPEAQMDRFALSFDLGYVDRAEEIRILEEQRLGHPLDGLEACVTRDDILLVRQAARDVRISHEVKHYIVDVVAATRQWPGVQLGASPRAGIMLMKCAQALSLIRGLDYVLPDTVQELAVPVIAHRLGLEADAAFSGGSAAGIVTDILEATAVPA